METSKLIISHRGNLIGPNTASFGENHPKSIKDVLDKGFGCEIDVRWIEDKQDFYLGHDKPEYLIDEELFEIMLNSYNVFFHCKDIITAYTMFHMDYHYPYYFFHQNDDIALIANSCLLWSYPRKEVVLTNKSIAVLPELVKEWDLEKCFGVCTDFPIKYSEQLNGKN